MTMDNLFAESNNTVTTNGRGLAGTAQLTEIASHTTNVVIAQLNENFGNKDVQYNDDYKASTLSDIETII